MKVKVLAREEFRQKNEEQGHEKQQPKILTSDYVSQLNQKVGYVRRITACPKDYINTIMR